jgi:endonuclease/exonuclease/phosphatase family metal-dependent hydrolase
VVQIVNSTPWGKNVGSRDSSYEELEQVFDYFPKYCMKILLGDVNEKLVREDIFRPAIGDTSLRQGSNENRVVNFAKSKNVVVKSTVLPRRNIHKHTWTSPHWKTHNQIDHVLIDRRWHSSILDVRSFRGADCDTDHYLVIAKVTGRLSVSKQSAQKSDVDRFDLKKLTELEIRNSTKLRSQKGLQLWRT